LDTVHYFDDLLITHAEDCTFDGSYIHPQRHFAPDTFSLEMICSGSVDLKLDDSLLHLQSPAIICTGDSNRFYRFYYSRNSKTYRHIWIDFHGERGRRIYNAFLKTFPHGQMTPLPERAGEIQSLFECIFKNVRSTEFDHPRAVVQIEQLVYLCLTGERKQISPQQDNFKLRQLTNRILANPFEDFSPQLSPLNATFLKSICGNFFLNFPEFLSINLSLKPAWNLPPNSSQLTVTASANSPKCVTFLIFPLSPAPSNASTKNHHAFFSDEKKA
jgi:hypothetical protein